MKLGVLNWAATTKARTTGKRETRSSLHFDQGQVYLFFHSQFCAALTVTILHISLFSLHGGWAVDVFFSNYNLLFFLSGPCLLSLSAALLRLHSEASSALFLVLHFLSLVILLD